MNEQGSKEGMMKFIRKNLFYICIILIVMFAVNYVYCQFKNEKRRIEELNIIKKEFIETCNYEARGIKDLFIKQGSKHPIYYDGIKYELDKFQMLHTEISNIRENDNLIYPDSDFIDPSLHPLRVNPNASCNDIKFDTYYYNKTTNDYFIAFHIYSYSTSTFVAYTDGVRGKPIEKIGKADALNASKGSFELNKHLYTPLN